MLLHTDPEPGHGSPHSRALDAQPSLTLRERLFGDRSLLTITFFSLLIVVGLVQLDRTSAEFSRDLGTIFLFASVLVSASRDRLIHAIATGFAAVMLWLFAAFSLPMVALAALLTALVEYVSGRATSELEESAKHLTRAELEPGIRRAIRLKVASFVLLLVPLTVGGYGFLTDGGVMPSMLHLLAAGVVVFVAVGQYRELRDFNDSFVGRTGPATGVGR